MMKFLVPMWLVIIGIVGFNVLFKVEDPMVTGLSALAMWCLGAAMGLAFARYSILRYGGRR